MSKVKACLEQGLGIILIIIFITLVTGANNLPQNCNYDERFCKVNSVLQN